MLGWSKTLIGKKTAERFTSGGIAAWGDPIESSQFPGIAGAAASECMAGAYHDVKGVAEQQFLFNVWTRCRFAKSANNDVQLTMEQAVQLLFIRAIDNAYAGGGILPQ